MLPLNTVICADAVEALPKFSSESAQAVIADPPYYNVLKEAWDIQWGQQADYLEWCDIWISQCMRILRDDGWFAIDSAPWALVLAAALLARLSDRRWFIGFEVILLVLGFGANLLGALIAYGRWCSETDVADN